MGRVRAAVITVLVLAGLLAVTPTAIGRAAPAPKEEGVAAYWTPARQKAAVPRDLRVDDRGLGYIQQADGSLAPHGHATKQLHASARAAKPTAGKPPTGGTGDKLGPTVENTTPAPEATISASQISFSAKVTDPSTVRSVTFTIRYPNLSTQSFTATHAGGGIYSTTLNGFTNGSWSWRVVAKDNAGKGGNTTTTSYTPFTVNISGGGGGNVVNSPWTTGGAVQNAAGRIYFEMPTNTAQTSWGGYVCSGTVAVDETTGRSVIITAAHCVYDDVEKVFARNVLFIPNQDGTTGTSTDSNCNNDPLGCWAPSFGVVDRNWTTRKFPANIPWDYAFYVVPDSAHSGTPVADTRLDETAGALSVQLTDPAIGAMTHALGYSYSDDPNFMYCAEPMATESDYGDYWLDACDLSGGSSGGPWLQPVNNGGGPIISVNSWGYTNQPGMGGPRLSGTSAGCVFTKATGQTFAGVTNRGAIADCPLT